MSIVRRSARPDHYLVTDTRVINDHRKSWAAAGLHEYLRGRPDDWTVSVGHLARTLGPLGRGAGRDKIYSLLRELTVLGYAIENTIRDGQGRFSDREWVIYDLPRAGFPTVPADLPDADLPDTAAPDTAPPDTATPTVPNTDSVTTTEQQQQSAAAENSGNQEKDPGLAAVLGCLRAGKKIQNPAALIARARGDRRHVSPTEAQAVTSQARSTLAAEAAAKKQASQAADCRLGAAERRSREAAARRLGIGQP